MPLFMLIVDLWNSRFVQDTLVCRINLFKLLIRLLRNDLTCVRAMHAQILATRKQTSTQHGGLLRGPVKRR